MWIDLHMLVRKGPYVTFLPGEVSSAGVADHVHIAAVAEHIPSRPLNANACAVRPSRVFELDTLVSSGRSPAEHGRSGQFRRCGFELSDLGKAGFLSGGS